MKIQDKNNVKRGAGLKAMLGYWLINWLNEERNISSHTLCDFDRLSVEIRPGDVLLVEGRTRVSRLVRAITHSVWTHSAIYIGRLMDIESADLRERVLESYPAKLNEHLLIEPLLGEGTIITPLSKYKRDHVRICRPRGLSNVDAQHVIRHVISHLGLEYNVRQVFDLARFSIPFSFIPRRWRSTLFEHQSGIPDKTVCSSMIASAFAEVQYPIRPIIHHKKDGRLRLYKRNIQMYVPRDFDTSPYFDILKYPYPGLDNPAHYRQLPWDIKGLICNTEGDCFVPAVATEIVADSPSMSNKSEKQPGGKLWSRYSIPGFTSR